MDRLAGDSNYGVQQPATACITAAHMPDIPNLSL